MTHQASWPNRLAEWIGQERLDQFMESATTLRAVASRYPERSQWVALLPLSADSETELRRQLSRISEEFPDDTFTFATYGRDDGGKEALLTSHVATNLSLEQRVLSLLLFDLHSRMSAWLLTSVWRADDLITSLLVSLQRGDVLGCAVAARALFEGAAAFTIESEKLADTWNQLKTSGVPDVQDARSARRQMNEQLAQAYLGTRVGHSSTDGVHGIQRINVLTFVQKFTRSRQNPDELLEGYDWLCDAVHPSYGSHSAYQTGLYGHIGDFELLGHIHRRPLMLPPTGTDPDVLLAAIELAVISAETVPASSALVNDLVADFGLTTGAAHVTDLEYYGRLPKPERNDQCPCGRPGKFKTCIHQWGQSGPAVANSVK